MAIRFNHTIVAASEPARSARFLADLLGRPAPVQAGPFEVVTLDHGVSLDFAAASGAIPPQHYAFLVEESEFDAVLDRALPLFPLATKFDSGAARASFCDHDPQAIVERRDGSPGMGRTEVRSARQAP